MRDSGSIVLGWLTRLAATIAVLGLLAFDGVALVSTNFQAADHATSAAVLAADNYAQTKDVQAAYDAAVTAVTERGETIDAKTFVVDPATGHVTLTLHREAATLWVHRVGPLKKWVDVKATGEGSAG